MPNYKVISSSCYGGNKVFYAGNIFKAHDVSEQDLQHLLKGGYIEETDAEANSSLDFPVTVIEQASEEKKILDTIPVDTIEPVIPPVDENPNPADLLADKKPKK